MATEILYNGTFSGLTASGDSLATADGAGKNPKLNFSPYREIAIMVVLKAFTGLTNAQVLIETADGQSTPAWFILNSDAPVWTSTTGANYLQSAGTGTAHNNSLGHTGKIAWLLTGTGSCDFHITIIGKN